MEKSNNVELKKVLKLRDLVFYGMIMMVLIAPVAVFGEIEHASEGMTPLVYIVGMVCMMFTALSYKSMSEEFPIGGSVYAYVQHGVNHASACTIAALSFLGFDGISTLAGEAVNPKKDIGKAIIIDLLCISLIFVIETYVACLILPDWQNTALGDGFYDAAALAVGEWFRIALVFITILAAGIANTMVAQSSAARLLYSMGRDRVMPHVFGKLHPKYKTPYVGILILAAFSLVVALIVPPATLTRLVNMGAMSSFIMLNASVFIYFIIKKKRTGVKSIFKYIVLPFIGIFILCYIFTGFDKVSYIVGGIWLVAGLVVGFVQSKGYKIVPEGFKNIEM